MTRGHLSSGDDQDVSAHRYEFRIHGHLGGTVLEAFPMLERETEGEDTLLTGTVSDQAALHGVLAEIEALGLELVGLSRLPRAAV